ncbi:hypothetical protein GF357_02010 [Candidatus Dojkabacteria bacterium]|nr:hypothetical protein [Candidatus Dojkabacteria bacterium]
MLLLSMLYKSPPKIINAILIIFVFFCYRTFISNVSASEIWKLKNEAEMINTSSRLYFDSYESEVRINRDGSLEGYAWSDDLGWIDFGWKEGVRVNWHEAELEGQAKVLNTNEYVYFDENDAKVQVDFEDGEMTGYAWSQDIGWIGFNGVEIDGDLDNLARTGNGISQILILLTLLGLAYKMCADKLLKKEAL